MRVQQVTYPTALPISLSDIKDHLRIEQSETAYDSDLTHLVRTAAEWVQDNCHIWLINTEILATFETFPNCRQFKLPAYPIQTIDSVKYDNLGGTETTLTGYQSDLVQVPASIYPAISTTWPDTEIENIGAVRIEMTVGYGNDDSTVPNLVKHLLRLMVGHWFKHREAVLTGIVSKEIELAADNLMKMLRVNEFEAFAV